jgi:hypothetical protein
MVPQGAATRPFATLSAGHLSIALSGTPVMSATIHLEVLAGANYVGPL